MEPVYFESAARFRQWLQRNGGTAAELWVGYHKISAARPSITWPQSVDQALCFGWIDGLRKSIDRHSYMIRFTPRKPGSTWSAVNIRRVQALIATESMQPAGLKAFETRKENRSGLYSYEQRPQQLPRQYLQHLRKHRSAHAFFCAQRPSYQRAAIWWVISAKQQSTRDRRLALLIDDCANARLIRQFAGKHRSANG